MNAIPPSSSIPQGEARGLLPPPPSTGLSLLRSCQPLTHPYSRVQAISWPLKLAWRPTRSITRKVRLVMRMAIPDDCSMVVSKGEAMIGPIQSNHTSNSTI